MNETNELAEHFSTEEIRFGIDQFARVRCGMTGDEFISKVRAGERVSHLHKKAQEVADLVALLPEEEQ
jgi:hypothetical protein